MSGGPSARALVGSLFISLKAFSCSGFHFRSSFPEPTVALYRGLAILENPRILDLTEPGHPKEFSDFFLGSSLGYGVDGPFSLRPKGPVAF